MPKGARKVSESGYYHVVPKGVADQIIFEDDSDRRLYVGLLAEAKAKAKIRIHSYCLMSNHVHLAIEADIEELSGTMKYVHERYAIHYAQKRGRTGGVFRAPFWSEPVESDERLLCTVRYIHANPLAAGICPVRDYRWSSARQYMCGDDGLADIATVLDMCGGREGFIEFSDAEPAPAKPFEGSRLRTHLNDDEVMVIAKTALGESQLAALLARPREARAEAVLRLSRCGLTTRQIARATGLGYGFVAKAVVR